MHWPAILAPAHLKRPRSFNVQTAKPYLRSFGRVRGKTLRHRPRALMDEVLPTIRATDNHGALLPEIITAKRLILEIGFGAGEHLVAYAKAYPDTLCLGAEPFENAVAKILRPISQENIENIRIHMGDARGLISLLPDHSIDAIYLLFPDPWPKAKHHKRRIFNHEFLKSIARLQASGAVLQLATDHADYACWMLEHLQSTPYYAWQAATKADWENPPAIWAETKYQRKTTAEGRNPMFFRCLRTQVAA